MINRSNAIVKIFQSRLILAFLLFITIVSVFRLSTEIIKRKRINDEISKLKNQIVQLRDEQKGLSLILNYLQSDIYIEEEVRKKFNLAKPGETIVVINDLINNDVLSSKSRNDNTINNWWNYFFNNK